MTLKEWLDFAGQQGLAITLVILGAIAIYRHLPVVLKQHREGMEEIAGSVRVVGDKVDAIPEKVADRVKCVGGKQ